MTFVASLLVIERSMLIYTGAVYRGRGDTPEAAYEELQVLLNHHKNKIVWHIGKPRICLEPHIHDFTGRQVSGRRGGHVFGKYGLRDKVGCCTCGLSERMNSYLTEQRA